jgi:hypothetical protein
MARRSGNMSPKGAGLQKNAATQSLSSFTREIAQTIETARRSLSAPMVGGYDNAHPAIDSLAALYLKIGQRFSDTEALKSDPNLFNEMYGLYLMVNQFHHQILEMAKQGKFRGRAYF